MKRRSFIKSVAAVSTGLFLPPTFAKQQADVLILGAGLSGLSTAINLKAAGYNVLILEASGRIGGRVKTLDNVITAPEVGGLQIGKGYGYMRTLAQQHNVKLAPLSGFTRGNTFAIDKQLISASAWPTHIANRLNQEEKQLLPSQLYFHYLKKMPKLNHVNDWNSKSYAHLDRSVESMLLKAGASDQAIALINANVNANNLSELSAADAIHVFTQMMSGGRGADRAVGGNSRFVEAIASPLSNQIQCNKVVSRIVSNENNVSVDCSDGSNYSASHCVCTIPFSVLRNVSVQANLANMQRMAIKQLNYTAITQVHFEVLNDDWLNDGLPASIWSNGDYGRVFASKGATQSVQHLVSWINGDAAKNLDRLPELQAMSHIYNQLVIQRPSLKNKIKPVHYQSWGNNRFAKGAYSSFSPGQVQYFAGKMGESAGNLHFAGEHTNHEYSGMESALVSGLTAANKIIKRG
jgi:monoamine oxidase